MKNLNFILKTRSEVEESTNYIKSHDLISHAFPCKDWDIALILKHLKEALDASGNKADILDMGSNGSFLLHNAVKLGIQGRKCGIDLGNPEYAIEGVEYVKGDLMKTPYEDNSFDIITNLSVIEHQVDFDLLAKECSRLLRKGGKLIITHDFWDPKVNTDGIKLYDLSWSILDRADAENLIKALSDNGLKMEGEMDWTSQDTVINPNYFAPYGKSYTFAIMSFTKI